MMSLQSQQQPSETVQLGSQIKDSSLITLHDRLLPPELWGHGSAVMAAQGGELGRSTPGSYAAGLLP